MLSGIGGRSVYFEAMLDKLGVGAQVVRIAEYKSAPEILTRTSASPEAKEQLGELFTDIAGNFVAAVAADRDLRAAEVESAMNLASISPADAEKRKLVDAIVHDDEIADEVEELLGERIDIAEPSSRPVQPASWAFPTIAVIHVDGEIAPGETAGLFGTEPGGERIAEAIRDARKSSEIDGIIVRVNSPGGAVQPSEQIARQVELTRGKKPIVVSMADVAASVGYMVSAHADAVFAQPSSITGSIGIFAVKLNAAKLLTRLGVTSEPIQVGEHAALRSLPRVLWWGDTNLVRLPWVALE